jgi:hypothetical protein
LKSSRKIEIKKSNRKAEKQKPGAGPGFIVESHEKRATAYPAEVVVVGRRAREVMPAAMSALDRISTVAKSWFMDTQSFGWAIMHGIFARCNRGLSAMPHARDRGCHRWAAA